MRMAARTLVAAMLVVLPFAASAQEATLSGTVSDSTGGVLPGVVIRAVHEATGNSFEAVTDATGAFRLPVRIGAYRISADLPGFSPVTRTGVQLLVGQQVVVNLQLAPATLQESVTVTAEAPLIETSSSTVASNIDPRQMQELPVNGRNWMDLTMLAAGSRSNQSSEAPGDRQGYWQINVDGQQMSQLMSGGTGQQTRYSRDAIAEFELITNRFDATMGRSSGAIVNAVTKSGTNTLSGTVSAYFRDDRFNAEDFIQKRVLPYSNQQVSTTVGGPIRQDRIHFFASYEYEHEPSTVAYSSPYPSFNIDQLNNRTQHMGLGRGDVQFSPQLRLAVTTQRYYQDIPFAGGGGAASHPSTSQRGRRWTTQYQGTLTQVIGNSSVNAIKAGYVHNNRANDPNIKWPGGPAPFVRESRAPTITLRGYAIGANPQEVGQALTSVRDDYTMSFNARGRHDVKSGGEYLYTVGNLDWCSNCNGNIDARGGPVPANIEALFPVWNDASTWNLAALSPITVRTRFSVGEYVFETPRHMAAAWLQDDWAATSHLTLNLGVRYDVDINGNGENVPLPPWMSGDRASDLNNVAPRFGFAYRLGDDSVVRGGYGMFYTQLSNDPQHNANIESRTIIPEINNDGRPDFAANPWNGPVPSYAQVAARACNVSPVAGCLRREITREIPTPDARVQYAHQTSIGMQRQFGATMAAEANFVYTAGRLEERNHNMNLAYNPATGVNYPFADIARRPYPEWGLLLGEFMNGESTYKALETSFTKRYSNRWQASLTYTLGAFHDSNSDPRDIRFVPGERDPVEFPLGFAVAPDLGREWTPAATDQRHRAVFNGIWEIGYGVEVSGVQFFGSGQRFSTNVGVDRRDLGTNGANRLRANGTVAPRNAIVGRAIHRTDLRIKRRFPLFGRASIDGIAEVFNVFNHENIGSYVTNESNAAYGQPNFNNNIAYQPRVLQLGFRFAF